MRSLNFYQAFFSLATIQNFTICIFRVSNQSNPIDFRHSYPVLNSFRTWIVGILIIRLRTQPLLLMMSSRTETVIDHTQIGIT